MAENSAARDATQPKKIPPGYLPFNLGRMITYVIAATATCVIAYVFFG